MKSAHPRIIQGGMGVAVSGWRLARAVSSCGQLGVVSGTALDVILARRLQDGDPGGHVRRALEAFPFPEIGTRIQRRYYVPGGRPRDKAYKAVPIQSLKGAPGLTDLCVAANFVEVFLAREGHSGPVGINYLEKIQLPHLPSLYGALLAGVDYVLMGAGIPLRIPGVLDRLARHEPATYDLHVVGEGNGDDTVLHFDPRKYSGADLPELFRPYFLPIISSNVLATTLLKRANGRVDGFVVEGPTAGGHNAPPRGPLQIDAAGEPVYGERDRIDWERLRDLDRPFWAAGGFASPEKLRDILAKGGTGIQVGTAFALCEESGMREDLRSRMLDRIRSGTARVFTDPVASPAGFPFKVARVEGTLSEIDMYSARERRCDLGYLRQAYRRPDGTIGHRCPAEPVADWISKGGSEEEARRRRCICNALLSTAGHPQTRRDGTVEGPLITCGDDLSVVLRLLESGRLSYRARDVVDYLLAGPADR